MARSHTHRWNDWRTDLTGGTIKDFPKKKQQKKSKQVTEKQVNYIRLLSKQLRIRCRIPATCQKASQHIANLEKRKRNDERKARARLQG